MSIGIRFLLVFGLCCLIGVESKKFSGRSKKSSFKLRASNDTGHEHEHDLPEPSFFVDQIFYRFSNETSNYSLIDVEALEEIMMYFSIEIHDDHDDHDDEHEHEHEHDYETIYKRKLVGDIPETNYSFCYSSEELMEIFHIHDTVITKEQFSEMSASILWMAMTEECHEHHHHHHDDEGTPAREKYLFGTLTIFLIWLLSFIAVFTIGKLHNGKQNIIMALRALAVGTLLSDALLHLIPSAFGLHSHGHGDEHDDHDDHDDEEETRSELDPVWKMTVSVGTIFLLWLFESFMHHHHHHDHDFEDECDHQQNCENGQISLEEKQKQSNIDMEKVKPESNEETNVTVRTNNLKKEIKNVHANGWIAFGGDALHKIADGLAIGAAFSESLSLGFSTGLAILFHELPHELGDFAVLLGAGFKFRTILILNTITSFIGLLAFLIITTVSSNETVREWIFAVTVGVFLYIALVNMVPRLKQFFEENKQKNMKLLIVVILSFIVGWVAMLLLAVFEEQIQFKI